MLWKKMIRFLVIFAAVIFTCPSFTYARIKLVALPERSRTIVRLDNPRATLIEEDRILTLQKGLNKVDFSWKAVRIDTDSIRLTPLTHLDKVTLLNVSYPPGEAALVWEIHSDDASEVTVRISYLLSQIDRLITYKGIADREETFLNLKGFLVLRNFSGEDFKRASLKLDEGQPTDQNIRHGETKTMLLFEREGISMQKRWIFDARKLPWDPEKQNGNVGIPVIYRIENLETAGLGQFSLSRGKVRLFQEDGHGSTIFLGEDRTNQVPLGEKMDIYVGDSRDIVITQRKMKNERVNIRRNKKNKLVLYDTNEQIRAEIENFKAKPAILTMIQHIPGQWDMETCNMSYNRKNAYTLEFEIELPANGRKELIMDYHRRNVRK